MSCHLTMPWEKNCECLLEVGREIRAKLKRWREAMEKEELLGSQSERHVNTGLATSGKKQPTNQDGGPVEPKQGGLF